ncbi:hypothetical protein [Pedobacter sp. MW01-1-1]|uniref:hypothetical protein n=1 Tax=Pedobacter sp. MW01-1-1 TaxID=3383027 RepID=UPI003FF040A4
MKLTNLKYLITLCFAFVLLVKSSGLDTFFSKSSCRVECCQSQEEAEKQEKKNAPEYFFEMLLPENNISLFVQLTTKIYVADFSFEKSHFPDVLTPPPLV